ncbi:MAG TPA: hypothetical protein VNX88_09150 [Terriglobales bacterium]|nr:hypothetical protein [Terriglobales bacterium]
MDKRSDSTSVLLPVRCPSRACRSIRWNQSASIAKLPDVSAVRSGPSVCSDLRGPQARVSPFELERQARDVRPAKVREVCDLAYERFD